MFIILDCPSIEHIPSLISHPKFQNQNGKFQNAPKVKNKYEKLVIK